MKRSEALSIIFHNLQTGYKNDELAQHIIDDLENAGLTPPLYWWEDGDIGSKWINGWEPEE